MTFKKKVVEEFLGYEYIHSDIVLIPGFRGSKLVDEKSKRPGWISLHTPFIPNSKESIDLPLHVTKHEHDRLIPGGIVKKVAWLKFYESLVNHLDDLTKSREKRIKKEEKRFKKKERENVEEIPSSSSSATSSDNMSDDINQQFRLHKFSYDWRRTNEASTEVFIEFLQNIYNNNGNKKIYIIAHSNGGLISLSALHQRPHLVGGIIFAGTPFNGAPGIFGNLKHGISLLFNKRLQDDASHFALRTVFTLMPSKLDAFKDPNDLSKNANVDYFDIEEWINSDWSLVINEDNPRYDELGSKQERIDYLQRTLEASKRFHKTLEKPFEDFEYPPLCTLVSNIHLTNGGYPMGKFNGKHSILYDRAIYTSGDSAVPFESTRLPRGIPFETVYSEYSHGSLLEDLESVGKALEIIFKKGVRT
jgi:pimeloyl-ACP methyl ester carboxylesterase